MSYTYQLQNNFLNCVWRRVEATAVNNLRAAKTKAGERGVHD